MSSICWMEDGGADDHDHAGSEIVLEEEER